MARTAVPQGHLARVGQVKIPISGTNRPIRPYLYLRGYDVRGGW